jgi:hypothetical protein
MSNDPRNVKWQGTRLEPEQADDALHGLNVFDRARVTAIATAPGKTSTPKDDWKNKFERHQEVIDAQRQNTSAFDARVQSREESRRRWNRLDDSAPKTGTGMPLDSSLVALRDKAEQTRLAKKQPPIIVDIPTLRACVGLWRAESPDGVSLYQSWEENDWNKEMLNRATQFHIANGMPITPALSQAAYNSCVQGNHLDPKKRRGPDGAVVRRRGEPSPLPPVEFPRVIWNDEREAIETAEHERAVAAVEKETQRALSMNFEELQAAARKTYKPASPTLPHIGG